MGVDDVLPSLAAVVSHEELSILGLMIWGEKGKAQKWVESFFAWLRVSESGEELLGYHIMCGDAVVGWGNCLTKRTSRLRELRGSLILKIGCSCSLQAKSETVALNLKAG
jgi:hypothetical protein